MKVGIITPSISRGAGGISEVVRNYTQLLKEKSDAEVSVFSLKDTHTEKDLESWSALRPKIFPTIGPPSFGYAPGFIKALVNSDVEICHLHILWKYLSIVMLQWHRKKRNRTLSPRTACWTNGR